jgi:hypothetical protein
MSLDPHAVKVLDRDYPYVAKSPVVGRVNCILHTRSSKRQMQLTVHPSRAVLKNEIHELVLTDEDAKMGQEVNRVAYLGFFEVLEGGMILVGDRVELDGRELGTVTGFDLTHFPNHINLCIRVSDTLRTGQELGCPVGARISFTFNEQMVR